MFDSTTAAIREAVRAFACGFDASVLDVDTAKRMVREWGAIENTAAAMKAFAAARIAESERWDRTDGKSAADWLARSTGTTAPKAREQIETGRRLGTLEATAGAARRGELSPEQTAAIVDAAAADPAAETALLSTAKRGSLRDLRERCAATKARADADPETTLKLIHAGRQLRQWTDQGGVAHLHANGPAEMLARVRVALGPIADRLFGQARRDGRREDPAAYAFDALVEMADGGEDDERAARPVRARSMPMRFRAVIRVDYEALMRGWLDGDETCEIAGVGPVPVRTARDLLGEATLHLVVTKGVDVANVTYLGRSPNAAQRIALLWQMPMCIVEGCSRRAGLEYDHDVPYAECRGTVLRNVNPHCDHHHDLKTHHGWALVAGVGRRPMVAPDHPDHPKNRRVPGPGEPDAA